MSRKRIFLVLGLVLVLSAGIYAYVFLRGDTVTVSTEKRLTDPSTGFSFTFTEPLIEQTLTEQDRTDKFLFRLSSLEPAILVSVRYEDGLRAVSAISKQETMGLILSNAEKAFPGRYKEYKVVEEIEFEKDGKKAAELVFTYKGPSGETVRQRLLILVKDEDTAFYLSAQTQDSQFDDLNSHYFDPIFNSASLN